MTGAALMLAALALEALAGWPDALHRRIRHPVVWIGAAIAALDRRWNRPALGDGARILLGALATCLVVTGAAGLGWAVSFLLPDNALGFAVEVAIAASLVAARSLHDHVRAVAAALVTDGLAGGRRAVARIVGRDPARLDEAGISRAAIESLAENASDGVVAPLFWGVVGGLPGLAAYKAVNTLDSMIGHRTPRHAAFGRFAARLDDAANWAPARLTGLLLALAAASGPAFAAMRRDARRHRSPNAGWPEAAMAGALGIRLSGPRDYGAGPGRDPWLNGAARDPERGDIGRALSLYRRAMALAVLLLVALALA